MEVILDQLNDDPTLLIRFASYYGNARAAVDPFVVEVDALKITLKYTEGEVRKTVELVFQNPAMSMKKKIEFLKIECQVLDIEVDKSYIPPGRSVGKVDLKIKLSSLEVYSAITFWSITFLLYFVGVAYIERAIIVNSIISIIVINFGLAIGVLLFGMYAEFPLSDLLIWMIHVALFGFLYCGKFVKVAYRFKEQNDSLDDIGSYSSKS